jgi:catechol 2,3-dioxygenase-like lactoylglutathione lyase family enzyme
MNQPFGNRVIAQIAIVVHDIEAAVERYSRIFGVEKPPVIITDAYEQARTSYHGKPTEARAKLAFFKMGQVEIELIEPIDRPSVWGDVLDQRGEGVHHLAFWVEDTDGALRHLGEHGIQPTQQGQFTGGMYTYVDSQPQLGVMLELLQRTS